MEVAYSNEMKEIDFRAVNEYGIPGIVLMENAAWSILKHLEQLGAKNIVIVCGGGNNGGDGFALARLLFARGISVAIYCFKDASKIKGDAKINFEILLKMGIKINNDIEELKRDIKIADIIVDAIFGTGLTGEIKGLYREVIEIINSSSKYILSVDIPSGIDSNSGKMLGTSIFADETVTFGCMKYGHLLSLGREASSKVYVENISIPQACIDKQKIRTETNYRDFPYKLFKDRKRETNKKDYGRVSIIGGSNSMSGALILAAKASLNAGCGLTLCALPESIIDRVGSNVVEATYLVCQEKQGIIDIKNDELNELIEKSDSIAIGPGLGRAEHIKDIISYLIYNSKAPLIIDADGLNALCEVKHIIHEAKSKIILTPHPGEMSRLTGYKADYINNNRVHVAINFAREHNCILLLKGSSTVITDGDRVYINTTGNPGMATGGSGDVLTGIIASFAAQGYDEYDSAVLGAYIHGIAGDKAYELKGFGLTALDLVNFLGESIKSNIVK